MNLLAFIPILSLMMVVHEAGHFITARLFGITVQEFGIGLPPRLWGFRRGGVMYSINWIPFGAFVKMLGEEDPTDPGSFASKPRLVRAIVLAAGSGMNFLLAIVAFAGAFMVGYPVATDTGPVRLADVAAGSPAAQANLQTGDVVLAFDGQQITGAQQFRDLTQQNLDRPVDLTVQRGDSPLDVALTPRSNPPANEGSLGVVLDLNSVVVHQDPISALHRGADETWMTVSTTLLLPKLLLEGSVDPSDARPVGLPGMAQLTAQAVTYAVDTGFWYPIFILTGIFSAGLSVANMLPIPALDGGRFLFVIIEAVRGRRIPPEREAAFHLAGIVVLLTIMVLISINDIRSPIPAVNWGGR